MNTTVISVTVDNGSLFERLIWKTFEETGCVNKVDKMQIKLYNFKISNIRGAF